MSRRPYNEGEGQFHRGEPAGAGGAATTPPRGAALRAGRLLLLGMVVFGERLRGLQLVALVLAVVAVVNLTLTADELPWIALTLAFSFGFYGLLRKSVPVDGLIGLSVETLLLLPAAAGFLWF